MPHPTRDQVAQALDTIATLYRLDHGRITRDDRSRGRYLLGFFGITQESAEKICSGMTNVQKIDTPAPDGLHVLRDIYGDVLSMTVRVSLHLPKHALAEEDDASEGEAAVIPLQPRESRRINPRRLLSRLRVPQYVGAHRGEAA